MKKEKELLEDVSEVESTKKKKREVESEEKLSMTRELKFKELQDKIDEEEADRIVEEAIRKSRKKASEKREELTTFDEIDKLLEQEAKKKKKKKESVLVEEVDTVEEAKQEQEISITKINHEDELYLTSSFKPLRKRIKFSKIVVSILKFLFVVAVLALFVIFVILPLYKMIESSRPQSVFNNSIDYVKDTLISSVDAFVSDDDTSYSWDAILDLDTNMKELEFINKDKFVYTGAFDLDNKVLEAGMYIEKEDKSRYGYSIIEENGENYYKLSTSDVFIKGFLEKSDSSFVEETIATMDDVSEISEEDFKYYVTTIADAMKEIINEEDLVVSKDEIEVDGITNKVVRNSLEFDKDKIIKYEKELNKILLNNKKYLEIEAKINGETVEEVKNSYKETHEYKEDYTLSINIYTVKGNQFTGFDIEVNGFRNLYYYVYQNKFEFHVNLSSDEECLTGGDCLAKERKVIDLIGTTKNKETIVDVFLNNEDIGSLIVRSFSLDKVDLDYSLVFNDIKYEGTVVLDVDYENTKYNILFEVELADQYLIIDCNLAVDKDGKYTVVDRNKVQNYTDRLFIREYDAFAEELKDQDVLESYQLYETVMVTIGTLIDLGEQSFTDSI